VISLASTSTSNLRLQDLGQLDQKLNAARLIPDHILGCECETFVGIAMLTVSVEACDDLEAERAGPVTSASGKLRLADEHS